MLVKLDRPRRADHHLFTEPEAWMVTRNYKEVAYEVIAINLPLLVPSAGDGG